MQALLDRIMASDWNYTIFAVLFIVVAWEACIMGLLVYKIVRAMFSEPAGMSEV